MENSLGIFQKLWRWWSDSHPMIIPIEHSIEFCNGNSLPIFCTSAFFFMSKILPFFIWNGNESIKSSKASSYEFSLQFTLQRFQNLIFCYVCKIWCLHHPTICWFITRRLQTTHSQGAFQLFFFASPNLEEDAFTHPAGGSVSLLPTWIMTLYYWLLLWKVV